MGWLVPAGWLAGMIPVIFCMVIFDLVDFSEDTWIFYVLLWPVITPLFLLLAFMFGVKSFAELLIDLDYAAMRDWIRDKLTSLKETE